MLLVLLLLLLLLLLTAAALSGPACLLCGTVSTHRMRSEY
jgi:hypothetical protein